MTSAFGKVLGALLLIGAIGVSVSAQTQSHAGRAYPNTNVSTPSHVVIEGINTKPDKNEAADERAKEGREESRREIEVGLTFVIALAACVQAVFAAFQWLIYRAQLKTAMPLVVIDWDNFIHISPHHPEPDPASPMIHHFHWGMRNVGQTPAFVTDFSARFVIVPSSKGVAEEKYAPPKPYTEEPLFTEPKPTEGMPNYTRIEDKRTYEEIEDAYRSGRETLYAFGYVNYRDRYGKRHTSKFCFKYFAWREMRHEYDGFGIAQDKQNKYT